MNVSKYLSPKLNVPNNLQEKFNDFQVAQFLDSHPQLPSRLNFMDSSHLGEFIESRQKFTSNSHHPRIYPKNNEHRLKMEDLAHNFLDSKIDNLGLNFAEQNFESHQNLPPMPSLMPCLDENLRHSCKVCGKCFRASSLLDIHMRVHVGAKPFVCTVCNHRATQKGNLKLHMKKHHGLDLPSHIDNIPDSGIWGNGNVSEKFSAETLHDYTAEELVLRFGFKKKSSQAHSSMLDPKVVEIIKKCQNNIGQSNMGRITESLNDFLDMANRNIHDNIDNDNSNNNIFPTLLKSTEMFDHQSTSVNPKPFSTNNNYSCCKICNWKTTSPGYLNVHMRKHKAETHVCPICQRAFKETWYLKNHMRSHLNEQFIPNLENVKQENFSSENPNFVEKEKINKNNFNKDFNVLQSAKKVAEKIYFMENLGLKNKISGFKAIKIEKTDNTVNTQPQDSNLINSDSKSVNLNSTQKLKPYSNPAMQNLAEIGSSLKTHEYIQLKPIQENSEEIFHENSDNVNGFKCKFCPKWFKYRSVLGIHARSHTGERPYKCPYCSYAGTQHNCLKLHIQRHHPNQLTGNKQNNESFEENLLDKNPEILGDKNLTGAKFAPAQCPICNRVSPSPGYLKIHMRSHKKTLDHVCPICGRGFKEYWYLSTHLRTHDKDIPRNEFLANIDENVFVQNENPDFLLNFDQIEVKQETNEIEIFKNPHFSGNNNNFEKEIKQEDNVEKVGQFPDNNPSWNPTDSLESFQADGAQSLATRTQSDNFKKLSTDKTQLHKFQTFSHNKSPNLTSQSDNYPADNPLSDEFLKPRLLSNKRKLLQPKSRTRMFPFQTEKSSRSRKSRPRKILKGNYLDQNNNQDEDFDAVLKYESSTNKGGSDEPLDLSLISKPHTIPQTPPKENEPLNLAMK